MLKLIVSLIVVRIWFAQRSMTYVMRVAPSNNLRVIHSFLPEFCATLSIAAIPTLLLFNEGTRVKEYNKATRDIADLLDFVDEENAVAQQRSRDSATPIAFDLKPPGFELAATRTSSPTMGDLQAVDDLASTNIPLAIGNGISVALEGESELQSAIEAASLADQPIMIKLYAPYCSHCKAFAPSTYISACLSDSFLDYIIDASAFLSRIRQNGNCSPSHFRNPSLQCSYLRWIARRKKIAGFAQRLAFNAIRPCSGVSAHAVKDCSSSLTPNDFTIRPIGITGGRSWSICKRARYCRCRAGSRRS